MKFCTHCGKEVNEEAVICVNCGCTIDKPQAKSGPNNSGLLLAAKILMIITTVVTGFGLIPLAWMIPMTVSLSGKIARNEPISVGFKVCVLIFANLIAGILLLCDHSTPEA